MPKRLVLLILSLTLITSCGFKLRGSYEISSTPARIAVQGGDRTLRDLLMKRLEQSGSTIVSGGNNAPTLVISNSTFERTVVTRNDAGSATGYRYKYRVDLHVTDSQGAFLQAPSSISQQRTLAYDPKNELKAEEEAEFLSAEMEEEIVSQILKRLSRIQ